MERVLLVRWNAAEVEGRAERIREAGYRAECLSDPAVGEFREIREAPPHAIVIDLGRIPSQGRDVAIWFSRQKVARSVPLVFVKGDPTKTERIRELMPDAVFTEWKTIRSALQRAGELSSQDPVVPGAMDAYTTASLPKKLGIRPGSIVALLGAPADFRRTLGELPGDVRLRDRAQGPAHIILLFVRDRANLNRRFLGAERALAEGGRLWIAWPEKASGVASDLSRNEVRAFGLKASFVDYKVSAIDAIWSGLCFARRRAE